MTEIAIKIPGDGGMRRVSVRDKPMGKQLSVISSQMKGKGNRRPESGYRRLGEEKGAGQQYISSFCRGKAKKNRSRDTGIRRPEAGGRGTGESDARLLCERYNLCFPKKL